MPDAPIIAHQRAASAFRSARGTCGDCCSGGVISDGEFVEAHFHCRIGDIDLFGEQACIAGPLPRQDTNWNLVPFAF
jgi:hypothetical protein